MTYLSDDGSSLPVRMLILLVVVSCSFILFYAWISVQSPSCDIADHVILEGTLKGFEKNNSYWDVRLDNITYLFNIFDDGYMSSLLGYNITITCCYYVMADRQFNHYDVVSCFITWLLVIEKTFCCGCLCMLLVCLCCPLHYVVRVLRSSKYLHKSVSLFTPNVVKQHFFWWLTHK